MRASRSGLRFRYRNVGRPRFRSDRVGRGVDRLRPLCAHAPLAAEGSLVVGTRAAHEERSRLLAGIETDSESSNHALSSTQANHRIAGCAESSCRVGMAGTVPAPVTEAELGTMRKALSRWRRAMPAWTLFRSSSNSVRLRAGKVNFSNLTRNTAQNSGGLPAA